MASALIGHRHVTVRTVLAIGTHRTSGLPDEVHWMEGGHPLPDERSVAAGHRALEVAKAVREDEGLLVLLSGGASALLALPASGLTLEDKRRAIELMLLGGADIAALNTVRKHISSIKGGRLARHCRGDTMTLAVSDVIGDALAVIGSGPGVPDPTTWRDAAEALTRFGGQRHPEAVRLHVDAGVRGVVPDTPKPGDPDLARAQGRVIASRHDAMVGAGRHAEALGYNPIIVTEPVCGEARIAAAQWFDAIERALRQGPVCVVSSGETTVRVTGDGRGGRNQEFALALTDRVASLARDVIVASVGTDGIDGPTDAAGALVDRHTLDRARRLGLGKPQLYLDRNDAFTFFDALGDLIRTGRTDTNVGDLQICLARERGPDGAG